MRRYRAHYDVILAKLTPSAGNLQWPRANIYYLGQNDLLACVKDIMNKVCTQMDTASS